MDYQYNLQLSDDRRSAFGLGWEFRRRGKLKSDNPFESEFLRAQFNAGWEEFKDAGLREHLGLS